MHLAAKLDHSIPNIIAYDQDWPQWRLRFTDLRDEGLSIQPHLSAFLTASEPTICYESLEGKTIE